MAVVTLPLRSDLTHYDFFITLDNTLYRIELRWNEREECWYLDLRLEDGTDIYSGQKVVIGIPLGARCKKAERPLGQLIAIDTSGKGLDPVIDDLGTRVRLVYFDAAELDVLRDALGIV